MYLTFYMHQGERVSEVVIGYGVVTQAQLLYQLQESGSTTKGVQAKFTYNLNGDVDERAVGLHQDIKVDAFIAIFTIFFHATPNLNDLKSRGQIPLFAFLDFLHESLIDALALLLGQLEIFI